MFNQPTAGMDIKATMFRNILLSEGRDYIFDLCIGWFVCVCLQNIPFLRSSLVTQKMNAYVASTHPETDEKILKKSVQSKNIVAILLGGAGYRGITNFISSTGEDLKSEYYAPRSHDFDISFFLKDYNKDMNEVQDIICQVLPIFINMLYNEMNRLAGLDFWHETHGTEKNPIRFVPVPDEPNKKEKK